MAVTRTPLSNMTDEWSAGSTPTTMRMNITSNGVTGNIFQFLLDDVAVATLDESGNLTVTGSLVASSGGSGPAFADDVFRIQDNADNTKQLAFETSGITTGNTRTLTVFDSDDTLVGLAATQTLTNKTLTAPQLNSPVVGTAIDLPAGAVNAITELDASIRSGTAGTTVVTGTAGTDGFVAKWNSTGDLVDGVLLPTGALVGTSDTQTLTNKTLTSPTINTATIEGGTIGATTAVTELEVDNININGNTISSVDVNGNIVLTPNGTGVVQTSKADINGGNIDGTPIGVSSTSTGAFTTLSASGVATFAASGTAAAPSITFSGDTDCGLYRTGANVWAMSANSVEHIRLDGANSRIGMFNTNPQYELDVTGDVNCSGAFRIDGNAVFDNSGGVRLPSYTNSQLLDISDAVNTTDKAVGKLVFNSTDSEVYVCINAAANGNWKSTEDGTTITPA